MSLIGPKQHALYKKFAQYALPGCDPDFGDSGTPPQLVLDVKTRWNSVYNMLLSAYKSKDAIRVYVRCHIHVFNIIRYLSSGNIQQLTSGERPKLRIPGTWGGRPLTLGDLLHVSWDPVVGSLVAFLRGFYADTQLVSGESFLISGVLPLIRKYVTYWRPK